LAEVWQGIDPQQVKRDAKAKVQAQIALNVVIDNFLEYKQPKMRLGSFREIQRYLHRDWRQLHGWPIAEIKLANIANILDRLETDRGGVSAARSRSALSSVFKWAMGRGYRDYNHHYRYYSYSISPIIRNRLIRAHAASHHRD
jgi:hypothetical protein